MAAVILKHLLGPLLEPVIASKASKRAVLSTHFGDMTMSADASKTCAADQFMGEPTDATLDPIYLIHFLFVNQSTAIPQ